MQIEVKNFINGKFLKSHSSETLPIYAPATGEIIGTLENSDETDIDEAVFSAKTAFENWSSLSIEKRCAHLSKVSELIERDLEKFSQIESLDTGKPISVTRAVDIPRAVSNFRFFSEYALSSPVQKFQMNDAYNYVQRFPVGVAALITPWNLPLYLLTWKLAPALVMGNTVVAKPSELTSQSANLLAEVFNEAGIPEGVFNIVHGSGPSAGAPLTTHKDVKLVSFTGGTKTGSLVAGAASKSFKKLSLELGGKNSSVVFSDCDLELTVKGVARAAFLNQGQICLCGSRILLEESIYDQFKEKFIEEVSNHWMASDPNDSETRLGALISKEHLEKVKSYLEIAKSEGGKFLLKDKFVDQMNTSESDQSSTSKNSDGYFLNPEVIEDLPRSSRLCTEEIFGPVVTLEKFSTKEEAIELANGTEYGLASSVWTSDLEKAKEVSEKIDVGMVWVNTWLHRDLRVPFGGVKNSGVGREGGEYSLNFFSETKNICIYTGDENGDLK